jgi:hypothetical protein
MRKPGIPKQLGWSSVALSCALLLAGCGRNTAEHDLTLSCAYYGRAVAEYNAGNLKASRVNLERATAMIQPALDNSEAGTTQRGEVVEFAAALHRFIGAYDNGKPRAAFESQVNRLCVPFR